MNTNTTKNHILERPLANAIAPGAIGDAQRRAIWAKRNNPAAASATPRPMTQTTPTPLPHPLITVAPTPFPGQLMSKPAPASSLRILVGADGGKRFVQPITLPPPAQQQHAVLPVKLPTVSPPPSTTTPAQPRKWGESRPGEMYMQVEGPGNPSWEKRHPELAPASGTAAPPQHHLLDTPPTKTPRASNDIPYGSDARTVTPADPNQSIRDKIDSIRKTLPATPPPVAAKPPVVRTTPGHPNPDKPYQTPPIIPVLHPSPLPKPKQPPFQVPAGVRLGKPQAKKSYVKNWYRGATSP